MSHYPHSSLFLGNPRSIVISGPHIQVLNSATGDVIHSTINVEGSEKDAILKSGPIRCAALDPSSQYLTTSCDDKIMKVWQVDGLKLLSSRELPKKPTNIKYTLNSSTILVSDKFGDIFSYPLHPASPPSEKQKRERDALTSHENTSGGTLILGHASLLTSFQLSADERYVISADRDEHVRVSWYPQGWNVEMFCLGHTKYVSAIHIPTFAPETLLSGGGDGTLKEWEWMTGKMKAEMDISASIHDFIKMKGGRKKWWEKATEQKENEEEAEVVEEEEEEAEAEAEDKMEDSKEKEKYPKPQETIQVLHKIDSFESGAKRWIVFSAIGATALFISPFPSSNITGITHFNFSKPVIDFVLGNDGLIWVLLDGEWGDGPPTDMVKLLRWDSNTTKLEALDQKSTPPPLLRSLNTQCLLPATSSNLTQLELYASLSSMPKSSADDPEAAALASNSQGRGTKRKQAGSDAAASKRQEGRLRKKMALKMALEAKGGDGGSEEREVKRTKSVNEDGIEGEGDDIVMSES